MNKMNNKYEAPKAEMIEIQSMNALMVATGSPTGDGADWGGEDD